MIKFVVGAAFGVILGVVWLFLQEIVSLRSFCYMLTLAIVLLAYALSESFGGSGAFSSLLFGLVLGNEKEILKQLKWRETDILVVDPGLKRFESEVAFLIRTFFFLSSWTLLPQFQTSVCFS